MYTLNIGTSVNCVPGNPADSGFGDGKGGLVIGLFPSESTTPEATTTTTASTTSARPSRVRSSATHVFPLVASMLISLLLAF